MDLPVFIRSWFRLDHSYPKVNNTIIMFLQLINHGIPDEVIKRMKDDITEFFRLPLEEKKAFAQLPNNLEGYGQAFVVSEDQKLDWADMIYLISRPLHSRKMRFWPTHPPTFRFTKFLCRSFWFDAKWPKYESILVCQ